MHPISLWNYLYQSFYHSNPLKMRKIQLLVVFLAILVAMVACNKDYLGVYQPKMKLFKVYNESESRYLQEQWIWQGDLLYKIDYYKRNGDIDFSQRYFYEKNRIVRVESDNVHSLFTYDGNKLTEINTYSGDQLLDSYLFTYQNNKLSHLTINQSSKSFSKNGFANLIVPGYDDIVAENMRLAEEKRILTNFTSAEIDFIWSEDNIQNMKTTLVYPNTVKHLTFTYIYDDNLNPKYNFLSTFVAQQLISEDPVDVFFNKHNIIGMYITDEDASPQVTNTESLYFSYDYYKKYPTKVYNTFMGIDPVTGVYKTDSLLMYSYYYQ